MITYFLIRGIYDLHGRQTPLRLIVQFLKNWTLMKKRPRNKINWLIDYFDLDTFSIAWRIKILSWKSILLEKTLPIIGWRQVLQGF